MSAGFNYNLKKQGGKGCHNLGFHEHASSRHTEEKRKNKIREDVRRRGT